MSRFVVMCDWDQVPHLSPEVKEELWKTIPPYQREARSKGIPSLGSGAIYPVAEVDIVVPRFQVPDSWRKCYGMDVGWNRTAVVWLCEEPQSKKWYAWSEHYIGRAEPALQAQAIRARGDIPGVIDPAARGRSQRDGAQLLQDYKDLGLNIEPAKNAVEAGLYTVWQMLSSGQLKIFSDLSNLLAEYRVYRRDERGHIVKENDHLLDATRYCCMSGLERALPGGSHRKPQVLPDSDNQIPHSLRWMG